MDSSYHICKEVSTDLILEVYFGSNGRCKLGGICILNYRLVSQDSGNEDEICM